MKRTLAITFIIMAIVMQIACSDKELQTVSKSMLIVATAVGDVQATTMSAVDSKLISNQLGVQIVTVCTKVSTAGLQVDAVLRSIQSIDPASRSKLVNLITPISQSLDPQQIEFIVGIKDPVLKQKITAGFELARTTISAVQLQLATGGIK